MLTSASASTQTTILPTARTSLSMAAYGRSRRFARIHPPLPHADGLDPLDGRRLDRVLRGLTLVSENILADTIAAVGLLIAFYYGLTGFACAWFYRQTMWSSARDVADAGRAAGGGRLLLVGAFLWAAKTYADPDYGYTSIGGIGGVFLLGIGSLLLGRRPDVRLPAVFAGVLPGRDAAQAGRRPTWCWRRPAGPHLRLPDSAESTVIAADLSNLPPGQRAVDPRDRQRSTGVRTTTSRRRTPA